MKPKSNSRFRTHYPNVEGSHAMLFTRDELRAVLRQHSAGEWGCASKWEQLENEIACVQLESGRVPRDGVTLISRFRIRRRAWLLCFRTYPVTVMSTFRRTRPQTLDAASTSVIVGSV